MTVMSAVSALHLNAQLDSIAPTRSSLSSSSSKTKISMLTTSTSTSTTTSSANNTPSNMSTTSSSSSSTTPTTSTFGLASSTGRLRSLFPSTASKMGLSITNKSVGNPKSLRGGAKLPAPTTLHLTVAPVHKKGKGIICLRATPPHTSLFTESPLLSLPAHHDLFTLLSEAPIAARRDFYNLHNRHALWTPNDMRPDTRTEQIWESNCLSNEAGDVVFEHASHINHDCCPNAKMQLYEGGRYGLVDKIKVIAKRSIASGEEITVDYLEDVVGSGGRGALEMGVTERREILAREWGFWCTCRRCVVESSWVYKREQMEAQIAEERNERKKRNRQE